MATKELSLRIHFGCIATLVMVSNLIAPFLLIMCKLYVSLWTFAYVSNENLLITSNITTCPLNILPLKQPSANDRVHGTYIQYTNTQNMVQELNSTKSNHNTRVHWFDTRYINWHVWPGFWKQDIRAHKILQLFQSLMIYSMIVQFSTIIKHLIGYILQVTEY